MQSIPLAEARQNLDAFVKRAIAGEEIAIEADGKMVALKPLDARSPDTKSPAEALRWLQQNATLSEEQATAYCEQIRQERSAWTH